MPTLGIEPRIFSCRTTIRVRRCTTKPSGHSNDFQPSLVHVFRTLQYIYACLSQSCCTLLYRTIAVSEVVLSHYYYGISHHRWTSWWTLRPKLRRLLRYTTILRRGLYLLSLAQSTYTGTVQQSRSSPISLHIRVLDGATYDRRDCRDGINIL